MAQCFERSEGGILGIMWKVNCSIIVSYNVSTMTHLPGKLFRNETHYLLESKEYKEDEPVVVCVHGIGSYHVHFESLRAALVEANFTVLSHDLKGRGYSPFPTRLTDADGNSVFNGEGHVKQMRDLIVGLDLHKRKYHLVGHSMGGALVALYASQYGKDEVQSLTMMTQAGLMDLGLLKFIRNWPITHSLVQYLLVANSNTAFWNDFYLKEDQAVPAAANAVQKLKDINVQFPHIFQAFWQSFMNFPMSDLESSVAQLASNHDIRTLIVWADKDAVVPLEPNLKRWTDIYAAAKHPSLETKVFKNAAHCFHIEQDVEFNQDMIRFLRGEKVN